MKHYEVAWRHATFHGVVSAVHIPDTPDPVAPDVLHTLPSQEAAHARELRGYRQVQFVGGRIALRDALLQLDVKAGPLLSHPRGAPILPRGHLGSVSHKRELAIAMVARDGGHTLGVDLEDYGPPRPAIAARVLTPAELTQVQSLPPKQQWIAVLLRFSLKESIYKALDPHVHRYVGFHEAEVCPDRSGRASVALNLAHGEGPFEVDARYAWLHGRLLTSVQIRPPR